MCCTVRGDLIRIVTKLLSKKGKYDHIIIETTGMADPAPVAQTFFQDETIKAKTTIDSILTVVDSKHVMLHMDAEMKDGAVNEAVQQVAFADVMLLNKGDLVNEEELANVERRCRNLNSTCKMIRCSNCDVDIKQLLGLRTFDLNKITDMDEHFLDAEESSHGHGHGHGAAAEACPADCKEEGEGHGHGHAAAEACPSDCKEEGHSHGHGHSHGSTKAHWDDRVSSVGIKEDGALDLGKLNQWFGTLLRDKGADIFRMKGVLNINGQDEKFVFQGVHMVFDGQPMEPWGPDEVRCNKLVFIGKELNRKELTEAFLLCIAK